MRDRSRSLKKLKWGSFQNFNRPLLGKLSKLSSSNKRLIAYACLLSKPKASPRDPSILQDLVKYHLKVRAIRIIFMKKLQIITKVGMKMSSRK